MSSTPARQVADPDERDIPSLEGPLLSAGEIAELFSVHPSTIRKLAREGRIPAYWVASTPRFDVDEVARTLRRGVQTPPPPRAQDAGPKRSTLGRGAQLDRTHLRSTLYE